MIDIVIPVRNAPEALMLTLQFFWANAYEPDHTIASVTLVDNCSTDRRTLDVLYYAQARFPKTHQVILNERNVGVWCSVNRGLAAGRSEFAFVLTSDVLLCQDALRHLRDAMLVDRTLGNLGPEVLTGLGRCPELVTPRLDGQAPAVDASTYNGAAWMLRRSVLDAVGWYDPRFYVAAGDTDFMERMRLAGIGYGVLRGVPCVHLDKQARRADGTARQDTETELKDMAEFARKWREHPDVLRRHTPGSAEAVIAWKEQDLGGWEAARVR
jgi:GT2 family glycosyltransferase